MFKPSDFKAVNQMGTDTHEPPAEPDERVAVWSLGEPRQDDEISQRYESDPKYDRDSNPLEWGHGVRIIERPASVKAQAR
jgi:hypothetical protein